MSVEVCLACDWCKAHLPDSFTILVVEFGDVHDRAQDRPTNEARLCAECATKARDALSFLMTLPGLCFYMRYSIKEGNLATDVTSQYMAQYVGEEV